MAGKWKEEVLGAVGMSGKWLLVIIAKEKALRRSWAAARTGQGL